MSPAADLAQPCGPFYGWHRDWSLPAVPGKPAPDEQFGPVPAGVALGDVDGHGVAERIAAGHEPFALWIDGQVAAYGWSTAGEVHVGEIDLSFLVPPDERYLWDFATLPPFRGRGLYPRLLQAIIRHQTPLAEWFWIGHESHNLASQRGIAKAGFVRAGDIWCQPSGHFVLVPDPEAFPSMVRRAQRTLGLPIAPWS